MKLKYEFAVRCVVGEHLLIPMGEGALAFSGMIATSETGAFLAQQLHYSMQIRSLAAATYSHTKYHRQITNVAGKGRRIFSISFHIGSKAIIRTHSF